MIDNSNMFANLLQKDDGKQAQSFHMATVTGIADNGSPYLTFYGEEEQRGKTYKRISTYTPQVNDVVICAKLNNSYTILGKVV